MENKFLIHPKNEEAYSYEFFLNHVQQQRYYSRYFNSEDFLSFYTNLMLCLLHEELEFQINARHSLEANLISSFYKDARLLDHSSLVGLLATSKATIQVYSSGTTGHKKRINIPFCKLFNQARQGKKYESDIWANAYALGHIGGLKVFFQAFLNMSDFIQINGMRKDSVMAILKKHQVSHVSATPTFYKMLLPVLTFFPAIKRVTLGGEAVSLRLIAALRKAFPLARINNIYASSEYGTVLVSNGVYFKITAEQRKYVKIKNNEIYVFSQAKWTPTGDTIKMVNKHQFRFVGRNTDFIKVGGQRVNLNVVQQTVDQLKPVRKSNVFARKNSITGNLICCELELNNDVSIRELKYQLSKILPDYKIPKIIKVVEQIKTTESGKVKNG